MSLKKRLWLVFFFILLLVAIPAALWYLRRPLPAAIPEQVAQDTFIVQLSRKDGGRLFHLDLYRLENLHELEELKLNDIVKPGNLICIEWADKFEEEIKKLAHGFKILWIKISLVEDGKRLFEFISHENTSY